MAPNCLKIIYFAIPFFHPPTLLPLFLSFCSPDLVPCTTGSSKSLANLTKLIIPEVCRMSHKTPNKLFEPWFININTSFVQSFLRTLFCYTRLTALWDTRLFFSGRDVQSFLFSRHLSTPQPSNKLVKFRKQDPFPSAGDNFTRQLMSCVLHKKSITKIQVFCDVTQCRLVFPNVLKEASVFVRCQAVHVVQHYHTLRHDASVPSPH